EKLVAQITGAGCDVIPIAEMGYDCQDVPNNICHFISSSPPECPGVTGPVVCRDVTCIDPIDVCPGDACTTVLGGGGTVCDRRNQAQKDAGCLPCGVSMDGVVITVTDAFGNEAMATIGT
ncbi:hypothetical protein LCGC14_2706360, partial [marine sediment metagenome]